MKERQRMDSAVAGLALTGAVATPGPRCAVVQPGPAQTECSRRRPRAEPGPGPEAGDGRATARRMPPGRTRGGSPSAGGIRWASAYYFRGIATIQNGGNNLQPTRRLGFGLLENKGPLTSAVCRAGIWTNLHTGGGLLGTAFRSQRLDGKPRLLLQSAPCVGGADDVSDLYYYTSPNNTFASNSTWARLLPQRLQVAGGLCLEPPPVDPVCLRDHGGSARGRREEGHLHAARVCSRYTFFAESHTRRASACP